MPGAHRLRADLANDNDAQRGDEDGYGTGRHIVQQNGEYIVDQHVAQQYTAQQIIAVNTDRIDGLRVLSFRIRARIRNDFQVGAVQRQQA